MKFLRIVFLIVCILCLSIFVSCKSGVQDSSVNNDIVHEEDLTVAISEDYYTFDWQSKDYTSIDLSTGSVSITSSGIYELHGTLSDGQIVVNVDKDVDTNTVFLILNNANITSSSGTPINIVEAKKVSIIIENGTTNYVNQGNIETSDEDFPSAAIYSKADLGITGSGTLYVTTLYNDGITSKDDLIITDGNIIVNAAYDGIVGKDILVIEKNGNIDITCGKDGLRSTNTDDDTKGNMYISGGSIKINAKNDGIQSENNLQITGGTFEIYTNGGYPGSSIKTNDNGNINFPITSATTATASPSTDTESSDTESSSDSYKGIKAEGFIKISGGNFTLSVYEDAIHSAGTIDILGGNFDINAGDDGFHSDTNVYI